MLAFLLPHVLFYTPARRKQAQRLLVNFSAYLPEGFGAHFSNAFR